jgi:hypothetical protein
MGALGKFRRFDSPKPPRCKQRAPRNIAVATPIWWLAAKLLFINDLRRYREVIS